jgi:hypothetical protein
LKGKSLDVTVCWYYLEAMHISKRVGKDQNIQTKKGVGNDDIVGWIRMASIAH